VLFVISSVAVGRIAIMESAVINMASTPETDVELPKREPINGSKYDCWRQGIDGRIER